MTSSCWRLPMQRWLLALVLASLLACTADEPPISTEQAYFFVEALRQVENGGRQLQTAGLDEAGLKAALATLDQGLKLAFEVDPQGLDKLDLRLGKNFQRYFIAGVENYRLGIEAGDDEQQRKGLQLLMHWSEFWTQERAAILAQLEPR